MQLVNKTPFDVFVMPSQIDPPRPSATIIVKATFDIVPDSTAEPADEQETVKADETFMDDIGRSLEWASDLEPQKPFAEVVVYGSVHAPGGRPATAASAAIRIGDWEKRIAAFGDRIWTRAADGSHVPSEPTAFEQIPLRWEFAFGGLDDARNPMGRGIDTEIEISEGVVGLALPNLENPDLPIASPSDRPTPVCLGPMPATFEARYLKLGTRDRRWATFRAPLPPDDFDPSYHNSAPEDQQFEAAFAGDEVVEIEGLHPQHARVRFQLPGLRLRAFILRDAKGGPAVEETPLDIDTLALVPAEDKIVMIWRGYAALAKEDMSDLLGAYLAQEPMGEPAKPAGDYLPDVNATLMPPLPEGDAEIDAEIDRTMGEAKGLLEKVDMPDDVRQSLMSETNPEKLFDSVIKEIHRQSEAIKKMAGP